MPLATYLGGDFESLGGDDEPDRGRESGRVSPEAARERVEAIRRSLAESTGSTITWRDEGGVAFARRFDPRMLHALRSFAAHHEHPPRLRLLQRGFRLLDDPREHKSLRKIYEGAPTQYEHLMRHSDNRGFYLPDDFPEPALSCEAQWWMIGSAPRLRDEIERIEALFDDTVPAEMREATRLLHDAAATATSAKLPLIWD